MNELREWALLLCAAAVICSIFSRLFPESSIGRQGKRLLPCAFLLIVLSPLLNTDWDRLSDSFSASVDGTICAEGLVSRLRQQTVAQTNELLLEMVNQSLKQYGMEAEKVNGEMDIDDEGNIYMGQITVFVSGNAARRTSLVKQVAEKRLGSPVTVAISEKR